MKLFRLGSSLSRNVLLAVIGIFVASLSFPTPANAQHRARMSKGLSNLVSAGAADGNVIYEGPQAEVDRLAATYGLAVRKRLPGGAVLAGSATRLERLSRDGQVAYLSEDAVVTGMMAVATQSTGANQLWHDSS